MRPRSVCGAALLCALATGPALAGPATGASPAPHPRATFVVTVKRRVRGHVKLSTWTDVPIRANGTLSTAQRPPATKAPSPSR